MQYNVAMGAMFETKAVSRPAPSVAEDLIIESYLANCYYTQSVSLESQTLPSSSNKELLVSFLWSLQAAVHAHSPRKSEREGAGRDPDAGRTRLPAA